MQNRTSSNSAVPPKPDPAINRYKKSLSSSFSMVGSSSVSIHPEFEALSSCTSSAVQLDSPLPTLFLVSLQSLTMVITIAINEAM